MKVSVVFLPTSVSVDVGRVNVPELTMVDIFGVVRVLLVKVSIPFNVDNVPVTGRVTLVVPIVVNVRLLAPLVAKLPLNVMVLVPLLTPVPPYVGDIISAFQVPAVSVLTDVNDDPVTPLPNVDPDNTDVPLI